MLIADKYVAWNQQIIKISIIKALKGRPSVKGKYNVAEKMLTSRTTIICMFIVTEKYHLR
jgi:hypothetical protein